MYGIIFYRRIFRFIWLLKYKILTTITGLSNDPRKYFYTVAEGVGITWTQLVGRLNIRIDVQVIAAENHQIYDQAIAGLNKWYNMEGNKATTARLLQALHDIGKSNVVDDIRA